MARSVRRFARRRGATITIVALSTAAILAMGAITVDLGMLFKMRGDAQRVADAAALAGGSSYLKFFGEEAKDTAEIRAFRYVAANYVGGSGIDTSGKVTTVSGNNRIITANHAKVEIAPDLWRVRVTVRRPAAPSFFGRVLGVGSTPIAAYAVAEAVEAGGAQCVRPFALADVWEEGSSDNGNDIWDNGEEWSYEPASDPGDMYNPWDGTNTVEDDGTGANTQTGWGSTHRNHNGDYTNDWGRQVVLKAQNPQVDQVIKAGHFFVWDMPDDPLSTTECAKAGGSGAQDYQHNICECNDAPVYTDTEYDLKPGDMVGPTKQGFRDLIAQDPNAVWVQPSDGSQGFVDNSVAEENWQEASPRVIKVALYDPAEEYKSGRIGVKFNNFALFFVEDYTRVPGDKEDAVIARFITYAQGSATPGPGGPLSRALRLVE